MYSYQLQHHTFLSDSSRAKLRPPQRAPGVGSALQNPPISIQLVGISCWKQPDSSIVQCLRVSTHVLMGLRCWKPRGGISHCYWICGFELVTDSLTVCCPACTPTKGPLWLMAAGWRAASCMWQWGERGLRSCPTVICSSPNPEEQGGSMGKYSV